MAHAYTPGLKVTERAVIRKTRRLPLLGEVLVEKGKAVSPDVVVARTNIPGNPQTVNLANILGVEPEDIGDFMKKRDLVARITGLTVFALGIAILIYSFIIAYGLFTTAKIAVAPEKAGGMPATAALGHSALAILLSIGALFIMVMVGSVVAGRGVQMYFAGEKLPQIEE